MTATYIIREERDGMYRVYDSEMEMMYIGRENISDAEHALRAEVGNDIKIEYHVKSFAQHECGCGAVFTTPFGWNNYGQVLRCPDCEEARKELLECVHSAMDGFCIEQLILSMNVRHLVSYSDFIGNYEVSFRRAEKMVGKEFELVAVAYYYTGSQPEQISGDGPIVGSTWSTAHDDPRKPGYISLSSGPLQ